MGEEIVRVFTFFWFGIVVLLCFFRFVCLRDFCINICLKLVLRECKDFSYFSLIILDVGGGNYGAVWVIEFSVSWLWCSCFFWYFLFREFGVLFYRYIGSTCDEEVFFWGGRVLGGCGCFILVWIFYISFKESERVGKES